jgi:alkanesulfonate monooxygenase SsuD/methylene tetrahydromethanopterin reductase-like flavin-dependent oxidoreductase (luciferase family)
LRLLWTNELVSYQGQWHKINDAGINPLPIQRPIPIWFGGADERMLLRLARLGDGWFPLIPPDDDCRKAIDKIHRYAREAGRDPKSIGIEGRIAIGQFSAKEWLNDIQAWKDLGATHVALNTMKAGLASPSAHVDAIRRFREATAAAW